MLNRTTMDTFLLFFIAATLGFVSLFLTFSKENKDVVAVQKKEICAEYCFPFASKVYGEECLCADLNGHWNPCI